MKNILTSLIEFTFRSISSLTAKRKRFIKVDTFTKRFAFVLFVLSAFAIKSIGQTIYYVDSSASGTNTGNSWTNAYTDLQSALNVAVSGNIVLVAKGTYTPSVGATYSRTYTFTLANGVLYYGGFPSGGGTFTSRDFVNNRSTLSGDIGAVGDSLDNCFTVVNANNLTTSTEMSGFTIEKGQADSSATNVMYGASGAIYLGNTGAMQIDSVTVRNTFSRSGSVLSYQPVNWVLNGCSFQNNSNGSAIYIGGNASGSFTNCSFSNNIGYNGGAIALNVNSATFTFTDCSFVGNRGEYSGGGGAISLGASACTFTNCTFTNNLSFGPGRSRS